MGARLIEGEPIAERIKDRVKEQIAQMRTAPRLAAVLASDNPGARYYAKSQEKACSEVGIEYKLHQLDASSTDQQLKHYIEGLNQNTDLHGVIVLIVPISIRSR